MKDLKIVCLHGTNYWNIGDLGLTISLIRSLQRTFPNSQIDLLTQFSKLERSERQDFDIEELEVKETPWFTRPTSNIENRYGKVLLKKLHIISAVFWTLVVALCLNFKKKYEVNLTFLLKKELINGFDILSSADLIISKPGGFIHGKNFLPAPYHLIDIFLATLTDKPVIIYAQSIGPFKKNISKNIVSYILRRCNQIIVRDEPSLEVCKKVLSLNGVPIDITADEAFLLEESKIDFSNLLAKKKMGGLNVGLTAINWHFNYVENRKSLEENYKKVLINFINELTEEGQINVYMFSFVVDQNMNRDDVAVTNSIYNELSNKENITLITELDPRKVKAIQKEMDVFIGSRMHSNIFALGAGVPVVAIAYMPKTHGIMQQLELSEYVLDIDTLTYEDLMQKFSLLNRNYDQVRKKVIQNVNGIQEKARLNAMITKELLKSN